MPLPAWGNSLSLSQIQAEFGGSNPASLSEYYAGGGLVPAGTVGYPSGGSAVAIPSSGIISINNFFGATKSSVQNPITALSGQTFSDINNTPDALSQLTMMSDGTWEVEGLGTPIIASGTWGTGVGGITYYIRSTRISVTTGGPGFFGSTATTGWLTLGANVIGVNCIASKPGVAAYITGVYRIEIATNAIGTNIISTTNNITFYAYAGNPSGGGGGGGLPI